MFAAVSVLAVVVGAVLAGYRATRAGYESAPYQVLRADGRFELRDYPASEWVRFSPSRRPRVSETARRRDEHI